MPPEIVGSLQGLGGAGELAAAAVLLATPEPTLATKAAAVALFVHGLDDLFTGGVTVGTGEHHDTLTTQAVADSAEKVGVLNHDQALTAGRTVNAAFDLLALFAGGGGAAAKGGKALAAAEETKVLRVVAAEERVTLAAQRLKAAQTDARAVSEARAAVNELRTAVADARPIVEGAKKGAEAQAVAKAEKALEQVEKEAAALEQRLRVISNQSCFAAGTQLWTKRGWVAIEDIAVGDEVWSRPESDVNAAGCWKRVEAVFIRSALLWELRLGGKVIETTSEHPVHVRDQEWVPVGDVRPGEWLAGKDGEWTAVEAVERTNRVATVYNLRVADYHTYFVGGRGWGFSVWAHNLDCGDVWRAIGKPGEIDEAARPALQKVVEAVERRAGKNEVRDLLKQIPGGPDSNTKALPVAEDLLSRRATPAATGPAATTPAPPHRVGTPKLPKGFETEAEVKEFGRILYEELDKAGYKDASAVFQGTADTDAKFETGAAFDAGRVSDFDMALADTKLFNSAKKRGMTVKTDPRRIGPLSDKQIRQLGLEQFAEKLMDKAGREVNFMIYEDLNAVREYHGSGIVVPKS